MKNSTTILGAYIAGNTSMMCTYLLQQDIIGKTEYCNSICQACHDQFIESPWVMGLEVFFFMVAVLWTLRACMDARLRERKR